MKQHGLFFAIFGGLYLVFSHIYQPQSIKEKLDKKVASRRSELRSANSKSCSDRKEAQSSSSQDQGLVTSAATAQQAATGAVGTPRPTNPSEVGRVRQAQHGLAAARLGRHRAYVPPIDWSSLFKQLALFCGALALPYLLTCLVLWAAGVFPQFTFWTITYARKYATALPSDIGNDAVRTTLDAVSGANVLLWILPWLGALLMSWERRLAVEHRFFLVALLLCSFGSISVGFYFRQHYFITLLPVMALLSGLAVSRAIRLVKHDITIELFLAIPIFLLFGLGCLISLGGNGPTWFAMSPIEASEKTYSTTLFTEARKLADYLKKQTAEPLTPPRSPSDGAKEMSATNQSRTLSLSDRERVGGTRIAVLGSEPEIYFYSHRRSATGYIYMYPLMETHPYAAQMQQELITQIDTNNPDYIVYLDFRNSWLGRPETPRVFDRWWRNYLADLELVQTIPIGPPADIDLPADVDPASLRGNIVLYRPKNAWKTDSTTDKH
jgi:hypothetical protein